MPDFLFELKTDAKIVAGVDEAGCGPWAGPVVAAAVIFLEYDYDSWNHLDDSKKLSQKKRKQFFELLTSSSQIIYAVGMASVEEIDELNIGKASSLSIERAIAALPTVPDHVLVDGIRRPSLPMPLTTLVRGDSLSLSIAAASIIAKVTRDKIMCNLERECPSYGWSKNAGYGTAMHQEALEKFGVTKYHRKSFAPIRALLEGVL